jgi:hypothetical protein
MEHRSCNLYLRICEADKNILKNKTFYRNYFKQGPLCSVKYIQNIHQSNLNTFIFININFIVVL